MKNVIKWLHLSDFHVGKDDYGQKQLFNEIIEHVKIQKEKGVVPDYLFITGDLADRGQDKQYDLFNKSFLEPLQAVIGNDIDKRTFTVPGNHDVDRAQSPGFGVDKFLELQSAYFDPTELGLSRRKILFERFASFCTYDQTITLGSWLTSEDGAYSYVDENNSLGIVGINTAWLCEGENDERQLSPGKALVENILKKIQHCNTKIVLGHHPINWFSLKHQRPIQALFGKNNVIYLHGHLHEAWLAPQYGSGEPFLAIQSGAAFQEREHEQYKNGFLWAELNQGNGLLKLQPRSWNINNQDWSLSEAFPEGNRVDDFWYFELPGQKKKLINKLISGSREILPAGWSIKTKDDLAGLTNAIDPDVAVLYFDGAVPNWEIALSSVIPRRAIVSQICRHFVHAESSVNPIVVALIGAGCEGKSTAILQAAQQIISRKDGWQILRRGVETNPIIAEELVPIVTDGNYWLVLLDDADKSVDGVINLIQQIPQSSRGKVHFLIASRDSDWQYRNQELLLKSGAVFKKEKLSGLSSEDASVIVDCWRFYGDVGLGELHYSNRNEQVDILLAAAKRTPDSYGSAFFGALLTVRHGNDLSVHAINMLERLATRDIGNGRTLKDALLYIAAMDAAEMHFLSRQVLAKVLGHSEAQLRRLVLQPLGEEAAATSTSDYVFTRHILIAKTLIEVSIDYFGDDEDALYIDLIKSAMELQEHEYVINLGDWRYTLADKIFDYGRPSLAIEIAKVVREMQHTDARTLTKLAHLYRRANQAEAACKLYECHIAGISTAVDRRIYEDWSISERTSKRHANAGILAIVALCDQVNSVPINIGAVLDSFQSISSIFKILYFQYGISEFRAYSSFNAIFGQMFSSNSESSSDFDRNLIELEVEADEYQVSVDECIDLMITCQHLLEEFITSDFIATYIKSFESITFNKVRRILNDTMVSNFRNKKIPSN